MQDFCFESVPGVLGAYDSDVSSAGLKVQFLRRYGELITAYRKFCPISQNCQSLGQRSRMTTRTGCRRRCGELTAIHGEFYFLRIIAPSVDEPKIKYISRL